MANLTFTNHHNVKLIASSTDLLVLQGVGDIRGAGERSLPSSTIYPATNNKNIFANWFISAICAFFVITLPIFDYNYYDHHCHDYSLLHHYYLVIICSELHSPMKRQTQF